MLSVTVLTGRDTRMPIMSVAAEASASNSLSGIRLPPNPET